MNLLRWSLIVAIAPKLAFAQAKPPSSGSEKPKSEKVEEKPKSGKEKPKDKKPEEEIPFPAHIPIPPATVLTPAETLKTIKVPAGLHVELVASEPMITTPVAMQFDEYERLWVVELNGYMPNLEGKGEDVPNGRVVILEDLDRDGKMDKSTVFLDKLVMPRAIALRKGGALICEPPAVYWCPDDNHDLVADKKVVVIANYVGSGGNPEHMANGLMLALDNWIYSAKSAKRYRFLQNGELKTDPTAFRGQWGLTQDNFGRIFHNGNSDQLRGDLLPSAYLSRNPNFKGAEGANVQVARSQNVYPARVTPGINRAYRKGQLVDGKMVKVTAACGPVIYRGDLFPKEYQGNSFVCEPSGNLVKRNLHVERDGDVMAKDAYNKQEFLTSTSERFRPVNLFNGPDGGLYCVDIARGLIQHTHYVTPWLRRQILSRKLDQPLNQGRIWRIVPDGVKRSPAPQLAKAGAAELVSALGNPAGWTRDTAQRLLVERGGDAAVGPLEHAVKSAPEPVARLHALWTLEGLEKVTPAILTTACDDAAAKIRTTAIRLSEPFLAKDAALAERIFAMAADASADVQLQLLCTLGTLQTPKADEAIARVLALSSESHLARSAGLSGLKGRELEFVQNLCVAPEWSTESPGRAAIFNHLARCVTEERKAKRIQAALDLAISETPKANWQRLAILDGLVGIKPTPVPPAGSIAAEQQNIKTDSSKDKKRDDRRRDDKEDGGKLLGPVGLGRGFKPIRVDAEPPQLAMLLKSEILGIKRRASDVELLFFWPGKRGAVEEKELPKLTPEQQDFVAAGKQLYNAICAACHQANGQGQEGLAPPIANSEWVAGPNSRLIRIILHGVGGPITVNGVDYALDMPGLGAALNDEQVAQVLSYIRREFGNAAPLVKTSAVKKIREDNTDRDPSWTADELLKFD